MTDIYFDDERWAVRYYGDPDYWMGGGLWGAHLRSCSEVIGYDIHASDGDIGHLDEYLIDPDSWQIKRLIIDTRNWLPGKEVLLEPAMIQRVDWPDKKVHVELTRDQVKALPQGLG